MLLVGVVNLSTNEKASSLLLLVGVVNLSTNEKASFSRDGARPASCWWKPSNDPKSKRWRSSGATSPTTCSLGRSSRGRGRAAFSPPSSYSASSARSPGGDGGGAESHTFYQERSSQRGRRLIPASSLQPRRVICSLWALLASRPRREKPPRQISFRKGIQVDNTLIKKNIFFVYKEI